MPRPCSSPAVALTAALASLAALAMAAPAAADVPPPDGIKRVDYGFSVSNLAAFPGFVVVAYPWSTSNGAPTTEHTVVADGAVVGVGRRSPSPKLWAVKKADYDAFAATYKPTREWKDPALEDFFAGGKAIACDASPQVQSEIPQEDPRTTIVEAFRAEAVGESTCRLTKVASAPKAAQSAAQGAKPPADRSDPAAAPSAHNEVPTTSGCAGCAVESRGSAAAGSLAFAAAAIATILRTIPRRRRLRRGDGPKA